jgi:hypothetical protein
MLAIRHCLPGSNPARSPVTIVAWLLLAIVASSLTSTLAWSKPAPPGHPRPTSANKKLLIVAPERFHETLSDFVAYKSQLLPTQLIALEAILREQKGVDDAEKLKRCFYDQWKQNSLGYVLLVGDVDVMPVRYMVCENILKSPVEYAFFPSDLYYADLAKRDGSFDDWNGRKDGEHAQLFGEVMRSGKRHVPINYDYVDYLPEIAVGRWPVSTSTEARLLATKTMTYEMSVRAGTHPGSGNFQIFHPHRYIDARDRLEHLARLMPAGWTSDRHFYSDGKERFTTPTPDDRHMIAALNEGTALVAHVGHGGTSCWQYCFSTADLKMVHNADRLPVLFSIGCSTAHFAPLPPFEAYEDVDGHVHAGTDHKEILEGPPHPPALYQKGKLNPTCIGEQVLKRNMNGAVVYIGCNTGSQGCAFTLLDGFLTAVRRSDRPLVGDCWVSSIRYYYAKQQLATLVCDGDWRPGCIFFQAMKYMFFGDPSLPLAHPR